MAASNVKMRSKTMTIRASIHVSLEDEAKIFEHHDEAGKYIVLSISGASIFIIDRAKALEIASLLESAAQNWEEVDHEHSEYQTQS